MFFCFRSIVSSLALISLNEYYKRLTANLICHSGDWTEQDECADCDNAIHYRPSALVTVDRRHNRRKDLQLSIFIIRASLAPQRKQWSKKHAYDNAITRLGSGDIDFLKNLFEVLPLFDVWCTGIGQNIQWSPEHGQHSPLAILYSHSPNLSH